MVEDGSMSLTDPRRMFGTRPKHRRTDKVRVETKGHVLGVETLYYLVPEGQSNPPNPFISLDSDPVPPLLPNSSRTSTQDFRRYYGFCL